MLRSLALLGVVAICMVGVAVEAAASGPPEVAFTDSSAINISADDGDAKVAVEVCNTTSEATPIQLRLAGFDGGIRETTSKIVLPGQASIWIEQLDGGSLESGACAAVALVYTAGTAASTAAGEVVAVAPGVGLARRDIVVSHTTPKAIAPVSDLKLSGSFSAILGVRGAVDLSAGTILLRYDGDTSPEIGGNIRLGVLASNDDSAEVWTTADSTPDTRGVIRVPIEIRRASGHGVFTGTLDTEEVGSKDKVTAITFTIRHHWTMAGGVFALGLLLAFLALFVSGVVLPGQRLAAFRDGVGPRYRKAYEQFQHSAPALAAGFSPPDAEEIRKFVESNKSATRQYAKTIAIFDMSSDPAKSLLAQIAKANADADLLAASEPEGLRGKLETLANRLTDFDEFVENRFDERQPPLQAYAKATLGNSNKPTGIPVGGVEALIHRTDEVHKSLDTWETGARRFRRYLYWSRELRSHVGDISPDRETLDNVFELLTVVAHELLEVAQPADSYLADLGRKLASADRTLSRLGARYNVRVPPDWETDGGTEALPFDDVLEPICVSAEEHADDSARVELIENLYVPEKPGPRWVMGLLEVFVVAVTSVVIAYVAARVLYVDKAWGSFGDYLGMFGAGIGADIIAAGVLTALAAWRAPVAFSKPGT